MSIIISESSDKAVEYRILFLLLLLILYTGNCILYQAEMFY